MLDADYAKKLEKYFQQASHTFLKKHTLREYINNLCAYLELPKLRIIVVQNKDYGYDEGIDLLAYFAVNTEGRPYVVFYKKGMARAHVKHELIHYVQFLQDGSEKFHDPELDPEYEMEADLLQDYSEKELQFKVSVRNLVNILGRG
tara:strand:- start:2346 stop:2783 length:438 start_codon:yes stop_codon:yes gene_type:complete